jgi:hypothetical protein
MAERPNWIASRARASQNVVFEELCQQIKADIEEINKLILGPRHHPEVKTDDNIDPGRLRVVMGASSRRSPQPCVDFWKNTDNKSIGIEFFVTSPLPRRLLTFEWDAENLRRRLFLAKEQNPEEKEPVDIWQVSLMLLEPFLPTI